MDFATLPPEINSGLMHSGPGAGSMAEAATAWDRLAAGLYAAAAQTPMLEGAAPYVIWLNAAAARASQAGAQAAAAARAHDSALAATVPPPAITANRAQLRSLGRRNCLAQSGPAIADVDAEYEQMWARDADAMYAYARAAADAATLVPFSSPPGYPGATAGPWALRSAPDVVSAGGRVMSAIPAALQAFSASPLTPLEASLSPVTAPLSRLSSLCAPSGPAIGYLSALNKTAALRSLVRKPARVGPLASFGRGTSIGGLSVPRAWAMAMARLRHPAVRAG
ncbi:PPE family protein [Mycobacterium sp. UM_CSW]|uniref:PPE family protein n=1 Tax=Mycobacterium sp. UM_CSW TaxID=1370119 RepID=UPI00041982EB|nr:PPE family protein [Mycobacterium sp. UM_CSW]